MSRILIADDEPQIRELLREVLSPLGAEIDEAGSGDEALDLVLRNPPDLVLLDLLMPGMTGIEVLVRVRDLHDPPDVIIVTAHGTVEHAALAVRYHARDFIQKPFDLADVRAKAEALLRAREERARAERRRDELERRYEETARELVRSRTFLRNVLSTCLDAIIVTDPAGRVILCNDAAGALTGLDQFSLIGRPLNELLADDSAAADMMRALARADTHRGLEARVRNRQTGAVLDVEVNLALLRGESGDAIGSVSVVRDVTERKALLRDLQTANERLQTLSRTDPVTGVYNHRFFQERLRQEVRAALRYGHPLSLVMFDLDDFKRLNDTHGHQAGDRALRVVAETLLALLRDSDILCRYGGEEFTILLSHSGKAQAAEACERFREAVARVSLPLPEPMILTASFGIATIPDDTDEADTLIRLADEACYKAKRLGKNRVATHEAE